MKILLIKFQQKGLKSASIVGPLKIFGNPYMIRIPVTPLLKCSNYTYGYILSNLTGKDVATMPPKHENMSKLYCFADVCTKTNYILNLGIVYQYMSVVINSIE